MKAKKSDSDPRIKRRNFSWSSFVIVFFVLILLAFGQSFMFVKYFNSNVIPPELLNPLVLYWAIVAALFSLFSAANIRKRYEKPMKHMGEITKRVSEGDFTARLEVSHTPDKLDYLDVMFLDFNKMVEELASIEILKNDFVSNVSHEIKTPLAVIQNYVTLLQNPELTAEQRKEYLNTVFHASEQLTTLVSNILRLSKLENQSILPLPQSYDVCRQLADCVMNLADQMETKGLEFTAEIEDKAFVSADESMMEIVWNNLLTNAIKFTEPGGKIVLTQTARIAENDGICVSIADSGCGMDEQTLSHIFDRFYQGDTSHSQEGYGLGLALVAKIIDLNGGTIRVSSTPGKGSVFSVCLKRGS